MSRRSWKNLPNVTVSMHKEAHPDDSIDYDDIGL